MSLLTEKALSADRDECAGREPTARPADGLYTVGNRKNR